MQGNFDLILRGKKKDIERFREVSGIINLPELPVHNIRELTLSGESFSENYEDAVEDDIVGYSFESSASHNINGEDKWAEEVSKAFPELELLMYFTYLDYEESGDAVYSAPGSPKCTQLSWTHNERYEAKETTVELATSTKYGLLFAIKIGLYQLCSRWHLPLQELI